MATDKRARKKEHRDAMLAQRRAMLRRRRAARVGAVATVIVLVVAAAVISGGTGGGGDRNRRNPGTQGEEPTPPAETVEPTQAPAAGGVACGAKKPPNAKSRQYPEAEQVLEEGVDYRAIMETSCGTIEIDLLEDEAPVTVNNFAFLAQEGFYNGLTFHRIEPGFVIQGGDPMGTGAGGPGYQFDDELWAKSKDYKFGTMSMANSGPNTNGSQFFFIIHKPADKPAALAPAYSMFGRVPKSSWKTLDEIAKVETFGPNAPDPSQASMPVDTIYIESVEIVEA
ncbi:MAG TPA: peptidylprolyl isomerase [Actinomycetota bacterium]|nr:peptidylprolyl isomerase [Actinomycetota bacterium]